MHAITESHIRKAVAKMMAEGGGWQPSDSARLIISRGTPGTWTWQSPGTFATDRGIAVPHSNGMITVTMYDDDNSGPPYVKHVTGPCDCACNDDPPKFCGGCGHAGCGRR